MLIRTYGLFWKSDDVFWGRPNVTGTLLGVEVGNVNYPVDFRKQIGVYVLYDENYKIVYVGQVGANDKQILFGRLKDHTRGRLAERWAKFSWFGLRSIKSDGQLTAETTSAQSSKTEIIDHIEAVLISATEPPHNLQSGRFGKQVKQYRQYRDEAALGPSRDDMLLAIYKRPNSN